MPTVTQINHKTLRVSTFGNNHIAEQVDMASATVIKSEGPNSATWQCHKISIADLYSREKLD